MGNGPCSCQKVIATHLRVCHNELIQISLCLHHDPSKLLLTPTNHQVHHPLQNIKLAQFMGRQWAREDCNKMLGPQECAEGNVAVDDAAGARQISQSAHQSRSARVSALCCTGGHKLWLELDDTQTHTLKTLSSLLLTKFCASSHIPCGRCAMLPTRPRRALANSSEAAASALLCPRFAKVWTQKKNNGSEVTRPLCWHPV